ncbi:hypothetical protein MSAN_01245900 [Mycena sanguinolenta]|uniref:Uncharacterized protein n=1 Tax=Mycena sanguinolenta TaxID=230812 RepID=A0A8H7D2G6_9AGAR|nr:hypothetical protein MSAN_01245900 [Mycena sanguinolenta]
MSTTESMPVDWTTADLPAYDELPYFKNFPGCAWGVWGAEDELGTVNLLTDALVKQSAAEEIRTGKTVSLNWQVSTLEIYLRFDSFHLQPRVVTDLKHQQPMFGRIPPEIKLIQKQREGRNISRDDEIHINTQSGTQWDGLRHFPILEHEMFYNKLILRPRRFLVASNQCPIRTKLIQPTSGLGCRTGPIMAYADVAFFLDLVNFLSKDGVLSYDPWQTHPITVKELRACAEAQGIRFRRGDILMLRVGFIKKYYESTPESRDALRGKPETFAGIEQSEEMKRFLWRVAWSVELVFLKMQPGIITLPQLHQTSLLWRAGRHRPGHLTYIRSVLLLLCLAQSCFSLIFEQTILGLWGMPIGEFFDLEKLAKVCAENQRYTFFVSSWPLNIIGGAASPPNAAAFF